MKPKLPWKEISTNLPFRKKCACKNSEKRKIIFFFLKKGEMRGEKAMEKVRIIYILTIL